MVTRALVVWFGILVLANINGALRELWLNVEFGPATGHIISTLTLCAFVLIVTWATIGWVAPATLVQAAAVGGLWVALTLAFEFLVGHYIFGAPWSRLLADYDVAAGRIWPLVLVVTGLAPLIMVRGRGVGVTS